MPNGIAVAYLDIGTISIPNSKLLPKVVRTFSHSRRPSCF